MKNLVWAIALSLMVGVGGYASEVAEESPEAYLALPYMGRKAARKVHDKSGFYWQFAPWQKKHETYLDLLSNADSDQRLLQIAELCRKHNLPLCREYTLRSVLAKRADLWPRDKIYKAALRAWLPQSRKRKAPGVYQLPIRQPFYVIVDRSKHHQLKHWAAAAVDVVVRKDGKPYANQGRKLTDHYCWGLPVVAVADGRVTSAKDHFPDMPIGSAGAYSDANRVGIMLPNGVVASYGHLQKGSLTVKVGDNVKAGQVLGRIGNSGASGHPHLHFDLTDLSGFALRGDFDFEVDRGGSWVSRRGEIPEGHTIRPTAERTVPTHK